MEVPFHEPEFNKSAFNCPFCGAYASFDWGHLMVNARAVGHAAAKCSHCREWTLWAKPSFGDVGILVYPPKITSPLPSSDMPQECLGDFEEARIVSSESPRAAAALLRLVVQKLCEHFGESGKNINEDIQKLVKKGLDPGIQKALDIVRVTGNYAVHPGEMNIEDNSEVVSKLFHLVNMIVQDMITKPNELNKLYEELPEKDRKNIEVRDKK
ncbi:MAG: DUF4145 domain-containing protein [Leptospirales bacterium]